MSVTKTASRASRSIKVAMVCPGVGLVQRGFERMFFDLFHLLKDDLNVTLYKGGGVTSENEKNLIFISRNGWFLKCFPIHKLFGRTTIHVECLTFAISLLISISSKNIEIIHCLDPPLARVLYKFRQLFGLKFRLLYSEGCAMPASDYPPADLMQQVSQVTYEEALAYGIPQSYMKVIPVGFYPENFTVSATKSELRKKYEISEGTFIILCIAAINKYHKRIDYLIDEFKSVKGDVLLWIDGSLDQGDPELIEYAKKALGDRCRITHLPSKQVGELFEVADLMVHTALFEAFGLALIEGASSGTPVLTHNAPHFRWLMNNEACAIDMSSEGTLACEVNALIENKQQLDSLNNSEEILRRYTWKVLKKDYLDLHIETAMLAQDKIGIANKFGLK